MIKKVYTEAVVYLSASKEEDTVESNFKCSRVRVYSCAFEKTSYGSVKIIRPTTTEILELYPNSILNIIHL